MHPDEELHRLANLIIAGWGTAEGPHTEIARRKAVDMAADVVTRKLTATVLPFPARGRPSPDQPGSAA